MTFIHCNHLGELELTKKEENGIRLYHLPNGDWVPSITTVTGFYKKEKILEWRKRVGEEKANQISRKASARGTDFHQVCQDYLENKELIWENYKPLTKFMFYHAKSELDKINNIHAIERTLYSEYFGVAGRVDCIAEYDGELAVIDFKTSDEIKPEAWIENYFVQEMFYAAAYYELTNIPPIKLITIMVTPNGDVKVFDKRNKDEYIKLLVRYIKKFAQFNSYERSSH
jgi:genome maintenance exonuclease 1